MKSLHLTCIFSLVIASVTFSQKFQSGYLTMLNDSTVLVDVQLTSNNKTFIKYQKDGKTYKEYKHKLKDYGTIIDGQKKSDYANSAFKEKTFEAYFISKEIGDTALFYFLEYSYDKITGFLPNREKLVLYPKDILTVFVADEIGIYYDGLDLKEYGSKRAEHTHKFLERIKNGKLMLYEISLMLSNPKVTYEKTDKYPSRYDMENGQRIYGEYIVPEILRGKELKVKANIKYIDMYILRNNNQTYFSIYRNTQYNGEPQFKNAIKDYPYLANKIGKPGYQFIDIPDIVEEYNAYWAKRKE